MATLLIHTNTEGQPQGVWSEDGQSFYEPGSSLAGRGAAALKQRGSLPWTEYVDRRVHRTSQRDGWTSIDTPETDLARVLADQRNEYQADQQSESLTDK
jgi:hypothetical protein